MLIYDIPVGSFFTGFGNDVAQLLEHKKDGVIWRIVLGDTAINHQRYAYETPMKYENGEFEIYDLSDQDKKEIVKNKLKGWYK